MAPNNPQREAWRERAIEMYLPLAGHLAQRFRGRGESLDDLVQVAAVGLIKAVDGFDPDRKNDFISYAVPTIAGELKRHFRDKTWDIRVSRRVQELRQAILAVWDPLTQQLGRTPTAKDLAIHLGVTESEATEGLLSTNAYSALSLDTPIGVNESGNSITLSDVVGGPDDALVTAEERATLAPKLRELPKRKKQILAKRLFSDMTQAEIGADMGISQMHVSRLLNQCLTELSSE
ncbi:MAG: SigB/SigF/SigG family RNA polymerase sigma factor [Corynebacteriales bacterium]|nr:SigB/SigF/SigG family RNA polymerase sigma factor [Mycobacteriales bacterium]